LFMYFSVVHTRSAVGTHNQLGAALAEGLEGTVPSSTMAGREAASPVRADGKVVVHFRNVGSAPVLAQQKFKLPAQQKFEVATQLLRSKLGLGSGEPLFLYCNSAFAPSPDELIADVAACFHVGGILVLNYCVTPAWG
jgi:ubiquitin-like protein ATG12